MPDGSMIFDWVAILAIGLMSVTIPTYAISVAFMGRERKRAIFERERRAEELGKKIKELGSRPATDPVVVSLQSEINRYKKDIKKIKGKVDSLSVYYACFIPLVCFMVSLFAAAYGFLLETGVVTLPTVLPSWFGSFYFGFLSVAFLLLGILFISNTLIAVNQAATNPETLSALRLSFESGSTAEKFTAGQQQVVGFMVHNFGKELGENIVAQIYFPSEFGVSPTSVTPAAYPTIIFAQSATPTTTFPNRLTAAVTVDDLHEDMVVRIAVNLTMPKSRGTYKVPADVWERRLGLSRQELTFEIS